MNKLKLITRWNTLPGKMIDDILAKGCEQCERLWIVNDYARLMRRMVGTDAAGHEIWQLRLIYCGCHLRLGPALRHADCPRWRELPVYDSAYAAQTDAVTLGEVSPTPLGVLPGEVAELKRAAAPVELTELIGAVLGGGRPLECAQREFVDHGVVLGFCGIDDLADLADALEPGSYAALVFPDGARLVKFKHDQVKILKPPRAGARLMCRLAEVVS